MNRSQNKSAKPAMAVMIVCLIFFNITNLHARQHLVGNLAGSSRVEQGKFIYALNLELPLGINGLTPKDAQLCHRRSER